MKKRTKDDIQREISICESKLNELYEFYLTTDRIYLPIYCEDSDYNSCAFDRNKQSLENELMWLKRELEMLD